MEEKQGLVAEVFAAVAPKYDVMNDLMSAGLHRLWKDHLVRRRRARSLARLRHLSATARRAGVHAAALPGAGAPGRGGRHR